MSINISENIFASIENDYAKTIEKTASGKAINTAADDPAGLININRLAAAVNSKMKEIDNTALNISMNQVKDAGLSQINDNLQQIREVVAQSKDNSSGSKEKENIQKQIDDLVESNQNIVKNTRFGTIQLIEPDSKLQSSLKGVSVNDDLSKIDNAIKEVSQAQADTGSAILAGTSSINSDLNDLMSQSDALSQIQDTDMAQGISDLVKEQIKMQTTTISIKNLMQLSAKKVESLLNN